MRSKAGTSATDKVSFHKLIDERHTIIAFLTGSTLSSGKEVSDYFRSGPCLNEIRRGHDNGIPIVFLHETDPSHGGVALDVHRRDCPGDLRALLDSAPMIAWYRVQAYQDVSLRRLAREVLTLEAAERKVAKGEEGIYHPREVTRQPIAASQPTNGKKFHVYASSNNPGAQEVAAELQAHA